jgi:hypothetical protein
MKRRILAIVAIVALVGLWYCLLVGRLWYYVSEQWASRPALPPLRAMMRDESAPRPIEPSVGLQVNEGAEATVFAGTPLWFTVGVTNLGKINDASAARARSKMLAAGKQLPDPGNIMLGDTGRPWPTAVEFVCPDGHGGQQKLASAMPLLGPAPQAIELDAVRSAEASFGTVSATLSPGTYMIQACLGPTGSWKGKECSGPAKLTIMQRPQQLTPVQEMEIARHMGRYGLRAGDPQALETAGRRMLAADAGSIPGHMFAGEAKYRQGQWTDALRQFTAARAQFEHRHPNSLERPQALNARIAQVLEKLAAAR